jgi:hypothetical protein
MWKVEYWEMSYQKERKFSTEGEARTFISNLQYGGKSAQRSKTATLVSPNGNRQNVSIG